MPTVGWTDSSDMPRISPLTGSERMSFAASGDRLWVDWWRLEDAVFEGGRRLRRRDEAVAELDAKTADLTGAVVANATMQVEVKRRARSTLPKACAEGWIAGRDGGGRVLEKSRKGKGGFSYLAAAALPHPCRSKITLRNQTPERRKTNGNNTHTSKKRWKRESTSGRRISRKKEKRSHVKSDPF
jgi:hypothetical protein